MLRCRELGVCQKSFCGQEGLKPSTFSYCYRKLNRPEAEEITITCVELPLSNIETAKVNYLEPMHDLLFLFRCYRRFGPNQMPWNDILPRADLVSYAESIGIPWVLNSFNGKEELKK